ncbi:S8 family serine peptidase [Candidatus Margulisiibacteriota bacterium]
MNKLSALYIAIVLIFLSFALAQAEPKEYVPGELIFKLKASVANAEDLASLEDLPASVKTLSKFLGAKKLKPFYKLKIKKQKNSRRQKAIKNSGLGRTYKLIFTEQDDIETIALQFMNNSDVEFAEPNYRVRAFITQPNDPGYNLGSGPQWHIDRISCPGGWDITTGSAQIVVAVIDSGIRTTHEDLVNKLWVNTTENGGAGGFDDDGNGYDDDINGWNFIANNANVNDDYFHGTFVSGIIGAQTNNGIGIAAVDWNTKLMTLKALDQHGEGDFDDIANAVYYAIDNGAHVINMSLGAPYDSYALQNAVRAAVNANLVCVAAMGNNGSSTVYYPAGYSEVIGVGATDQSDLRANFSTYGSGSQITELCAPGVDIYSTTTPNNNSYAVGSGTSFAAPMVSGLASLLFAKQPTMSVSDMRILMHLSANDLGSTGPDKYFGHGRINVENALNNIYPGGKGLQISQMMNFPNPANDDGTCFSFYLNDYASITIKVFTPHGELIKTIDGGITNGKYHKACWDCKDDSGKIIPNGSYIYVVIAEGTQKEKVFKKGKMAMLK